MKMQKRRITFTTVAIGVLIIVVAIVVLRRKEPTTVETATVQRGDITAIVSASGTVQPVRLVQISSAIAGEIRQLPVQEGVNVRMGQVLVQLKQSAFEAQVRRARAGLEIARASLQASEARYKRARALFSSQLISQQEVETAQSEFLLDKARTQEAQAVLDEALDQLRETTITSPIKGTIIRLNVELGETVVPGTLSTPGTVLMVIADLSRMEVECEVGETDITQVKTGQIANIEVDAIADRTLNGEVTEIGPATNKSTTELPEGQVNETIVNYIVSVLIRDSIATLRPGMTANADIITSQMTNILIVPIQAVITRPRIQIDSTDTSTLISGKEETEAVFRYHDGTARLTAVKTGIIGEDDIQITTGLSEGERIIIGPFAVLRELKNGARVTARTAREKMRITP